MIHIFEGSIFIENVEEFLQKLKKTAKEKNAVLQALDADKLAGEVHVKFAVEKAVRSFENKRNIAKELAKEIMLYASGSRQISRAMKLGIHKGLNNLVLVAVGDNLDASVFSDLAEIEQKPVLRYDNSKKKALMEAFGITEEEIKAAGEEKIPDLVIERVALLDVLK
jgi:KEOPS complex subunit Cgi121